MSKIVTIYGVDFRPGQVDWEDAYGQMRAELPDFWKLRAGKETVGKIISTIGLVAQVGNYWVIVTEYGANDGVFDYTIVPMRAKVRVLWAAKRH